MYKEKHRKIIGDDKQTMILEYFNPYFFVI